MTARLLHLLAFCDCTSAATATSTQQVLFAHRQSYNKVLNAIANTQDSMLCAGQVQAGPTLQCSPVRATFLRTITAPTSLLAHKHNPQAGTSHQPCHGRGHCQLSFTFGSLGINGAVHHCVTARGRTIPNCVPSRGHALAGITFSVTIR